MSREQEERGMSTADLVAAADAPVRTADRTPEPSQGAEPELRSQEARQDPSSTPGETSQREPMAALFAPDVASDFESRWDVVQIGFVDDPRDAVRQADELVAQVMKSLAESFANERERIENQLDASDSEATENMRVALRRYRSFFQRLLSL